MSALPVAFPEISGQRSQLRRPTARLVWMPARAPSRERPQRLATGSSLIEGLLS
jgi:hypothetical protein